MVLYVLYFWALLLSKVMPLFLILFLILFISKKYFLFFCRFYLTFSILCITL